MKFSEAKEDAASGLYVQFKDGKSVTIRLVTEVTPVWKAFFTNEDGKQKARVFLTETAAKEFNHKIDATDLTETEKNKQKAKIAYACYALNRDEGNRLQIAELRPSMITQIGEYQITEGYTFDTVPPYDFIVKRAGSGLTTKYTVTPARQNTDLTDEEKTTIVNAEPLSVVLRKDAEDKDQVAPF